MTWPQGSARMINSAANTRRFTMTKLRSIAFLFLVPLALVPARGVEEKQAIKVSLDAPATNYSLSITQAYHVGEETWIVAQVNKKGDFGGQAITRISDEIKLDAPKRKVVVHVLGKTWNWSGDEGYSYPKSRKELDAMLKEKEAKLIWEREAGKGKKAK